MSRLVIGLFGTWEGYCIRLRHGVAIGGDIGQPHDLYDARSLGDNHQQRLDLSWMAPPLHKIWHEDRQEVKVPRRLMDAVFGPTKTRNEVREWLSRKGGRMDRTAWLV